MSGSDDIDQLTVTEMNYILVAENAILLLFCQSSGAKAKYCKN
jgi:hypothetical protein